LSAFIRLDDSPRLLKSADCTDEDMVGLYAMRTGNNSQLYDILVSYYIEYENTLISTIHK